MKIDFLKAAARIPSDQLEDLGPVGEPVGAPVSRLRGRVLYAGPDGAVEAGVWECSPGRWRRQVKQAEFCQFLAGRCVFHADSGQHLEIQAGDAVHFPANSMGTWEIIETVRKTYLTY